MVEETDEKVAGVADEEEAEEKDDGQGVSYILITRLTARLKAPCVR